MSSSSGKITEVDVAVGLLIRHGRVLVTRRAHDTSFANQWEYPGGKIESGESPERAVQRELREELTVVVSRPELLFRAVNRYHGRRVFKVAYFACREFTGIAHAVVAGTAAWIPIDLLPGFSMIDTRGAMIAAALRRRGFA